MSALDDVLADLAAESSALDRVVSGLTDEQWRTATPAEGWDIAHQIAHLAWTDEAAVLAASDKVGWDLVVLSAIDDPTGFVDRAAEHGAADAGAGLLARWRHARATLAEALTSIPAGERMPWFGPPMSPTSMATARFMETWAHGLDVTDALGLTVEPTDRIRNVAHIGVRTRNYAFLANELDPPADEFRIELTSPSGEVWSWGPEDAAQTVTGSAYDFCLLVTQRRHREDTDLVAVGDQAEQWLGIAQCFAGPAGKGRQRRG